MNYIFSLSPEKGKERSKVDLSKIYKYLSEVLMQDLNITKLDRTNTICLLNSLENIEKQAKLVSCKQLDDEMNKRFGSSPLPTIFIRMYHLILLIWFILDTRLSLSIVDQSKVLKKSVNVSVVYRNIDLLKTFLRLYWRKSKFRSK